MWNEKVLETYSRGQIRLIQDTLSDGSKVYSVQIVVSEPIPVVDLKSGLELCQCFVKNTI